MSKNVCFKTYSKLDLILKDTLGMLPKVDAIEDLFKAWFRMNKSMYTNSMKSLPARILTIDHTFKVTSNVGMFRQGDNKEWVKLYNSLFVALNKRKQIVTWHFTQGEKFSLVRDILDKLKERENFKIEMVLLDNCCKYDLVINDIFGNQIFIKLDPFHGIQRITSTIRKKHPFHQQLCSDLHNLLRHPTDLSSKRRTVETASKEIILELLDRIVAKWESLEFMLDERSLITMETREAFLNLRKHISKGCLSNIPAGCSTSVNENLHKYLNKPWALSLQRLYSPFFSTIGMKGLEWSSVQTMKRVKCLDLED
uniref:Uncharacterized protein n=2 Tax=Clytia hemisphaerica TaxID=252671 RepID=A0A7M5XP13_9CNID